MLENSWEMFNLCREYLKENETGWARRSTEKMKRIREEEKEERLRIIEEKRKKFGKKNIAKKIDRNDELAKLTKKRLEISEAKRNY